MIEHYANKRKTLSPRPARYFLLLLGFIVLFYVTPTAGETISNIDTKMNLLKQFSLEELSDLEVTSVSKTPEKLSDAAAAIFVISSEDLRRGGFLSIPEALRLVPGVQVAQIDANKWAISARGSNSWFANKLLVLIDGRSVYSPLYSGVWWDVQDTMIEDIERIEVIRGPGATLWGANAVNGVINIITKKAQETHGTLVSAGIGNLEQGFGRLRHGGSIGDNAWYRGYLKYFKRDNFETKSGDQADDAWDSLRGGFRVDWQATENSSITFQGDIYSGNTGTSCNYSGTIPPRTFDVNGDISGGNLLGRWTRTLAKDSQMSFQAYYDRTYRYMKIISETRDTFDLEFQHSFTWGEQQQVVWGSGYRITHDHNDKQELINFDPDSRTDNIFSAFIQDRISFLQDQLVITLGSKFEHNDYSGFEIQPSARIRWTPVAGHTLWAAVSRAVRTPSRTDHDLKAIMATFYTGPTLNIVTLNGNDDFDSEELTAYEIGYRFQPTSRFSFDVSAFYNIYHDLRDTVSDPPSSPVSAFPPPPQREWPQYVVNRLHVDTYGIEVSSSLEMVEWWQLKGAYSWLYTHLYGNKSCGGLENAEGNSPSHQITLQSFINLPGNFEFDSTLLYVDNLSSEYMNVPSYTRIDLRLGWQPWQNLELSLKAENLLDRRHPEYDDTRGIIASQIPRSFYGKVTWQF